MKLYFNKGYTEGGLSLFLHIDQFFYGIIWYIKFCLYIMVTVIICMKKFCRKNIVDRFAAVCFNRCNVSLITLKIHFDTFSTDPAVHTIDTISICMKKFGC